MKKQDYNNHVRWYAPHHFIFYPVAGAFVSFSGYMALTNEAARMPWMIITAIGLLLIWTSLMMRQHYGLSNQNRTVRLEMRFRYYVLTQQRLEPLEEKLGFSRIAALRFASDEELPALVQKTLQENLTADQIKKAIRNWEPDTMRV